MCACACACVYVRVLWGEGTFPFSCTAPFLEGAEAGLVKAGCPLLGRSAGTSANPTHDSFETWGGKQIPSDRNGTDLPVLP